MRAHRGIDATARARPALGVVLFDDLGIQVLAHAVQALELEVAAVAGQVADIRQGMSVVGGKLAIEDIGVGEDAPRAGHVGHIGIGLAGEYRITGQAGLLGALDFGVPVGAFHQPDHDAPAVAPPDGRQPVDGIQRAFLIGLQGQAQALPVAEHGIARGHLEQLQRQIQAVGFFSVNGQVDVVFRGQARELLQTRKQLGDHALAVAQLIAGVQRRKLDRYAGRVFGPAITAFFAAGHDSVVIVVEITLGVGIGARGFAQHVVGIRIAAFLQGSGVLDGLVDGPAHHELVAHQAHGPAHGLADERLAGAADQALQRGFEVALGQVIATQHAPGDHQAPGGGVDEPGLGFAQMALPVGAADLVFDQLVHGFGIRDA